MAAQGPTYLHCIAEGAFMSTRQIEPMIGKVHGIWCKTH